MEKREILKRLEEMKNNPQIALDFDSYEGPRICDVALTNGYYDEFIDLISPRTYKINGEDVVKIVIDPFSSVTEQNISVAEKVEAGLYSLKTIKYLLEFGEKKEVKEELERRRVLKAIYSFDFDKISKMRINQSHARQIPYTGAPITSSFDVLKYLEPALVLAGMECFGKGIRTVSCDTPFVIEDGNELGMAKANLIVDFKTLSDENKVIANALIDEGMGHREIIQDEHSLSDSFFSEVTVKANETIGSLSNRFVAIVRNFQNQKDLKKANNLSL